MLDNLSKEQKEHLSSLDLAYLGDAVYELMVRKHLLAQGFLGNKALHKQAVRYVCADTQAKALRFLESELETEEAAIAKRGRNAKNGHSPRSASVTAYRWSTGLEALVGYLFLENRLERLEALMKQIFQWVENGGMNESGE